VVTHLPIPEVEEGLSPSEYLKQRGLLDGKLEIPTRVGPRDFVRELGEEDE
jgi:hypothetical protein